MSTDDLPALRNNNPGNLEYNPNVNYEGLADPPNDGKWFRFVAPEYGLRAVMKDIHACYAVHGLKTVKEILNRYAPPNENNTQAYIDAICKWNGWEEDDELDFISAETYIGFAQAISIHESGMNPNRPPIAWYSDSIYEKAFQLTGIS